MLKQLVSLCFEIYLFVTGSIGIAIWSVNWLWPSIRRRLNSHYLKTNLNKLLWFFIIISGFIYALISLIGFQLLIFIIIRIAIGVASIYALVIFVDWISLRTGINFDVTVASLCLVIFLILGVNGSYKYIFPHIETYNQSRAFSLSRNPGKPIFVGDYHEHDPITFQSDGDFILRVIDDKNNLNDEYPIRQDRGFGWYHSFAETGKLYLQATPNSQTSKVNLNIIHRFTWKRLTLRNHWFLRNSIPYTIIVFIILFLSPKRQIRRKTMHDLGEALPQEMESTIHDIAFKNPVEVGSFMLQQLFRRIGLGQIRRTSKTQNDLYLAYKEYLETKYNVESLKRKLKRIDLEHEVEVARLEAEKARHKHEKGEHEEAFRKQQCHEILAKNWNEIEKVTLDMVKEILNMRLADEHYTILLSKPKDLREYLERLIEETNCTPQRFRSIIESLIKEHKKSAYQEEYQEQEDSSQVRDAGRDHRINRREKLVKDNIEFEKKSEEDPEMADHYKKIIKLNEIEIKNIDNELKGL